jgi:hypothetical protein
MWESFFSYKKNMKANLIATKISRTYFVNFLSVKGFDKNSSQDTIKPKYYV